MTAVPAVAEVVGGRDEGVSLDAASASLLDLDDTRLPSCRDQIAKRLGDGYRSGAAPFSK